MMWDRGKMADSLVFDASDASSLIDRYTRTHARAHAIRPISESASDASEPVEKREPVPPKSPLSVTTDVAATRASNPPICPWCSRPFRSRRTGGRSQRFCRPICRRQFHAAARRWAVDMIDAGNLTVADLKNGRVATCALALGRSDAPPLPEPRSSDQRAVEAPEAAREQDHV